MRVRCLQACHEMHGPRSSSAQPAHPLSLPPGQVRRPGCHRGAMPRCWSKPWRQPAPTSSAPRLTVPARCAAPMRRHLRWRRRWAPAWQRPAATRVCTTPPALRLGRSQRRMAAQTAARQAPMRSWQLSCWAGGGMSSSSAGKRTGAARATHPALVPPQPACWQRATGSRPPWPTLRSPVPPPTRARRSTARARCGGSGRAGERAAAWERCCHRLARRLSGPTLVGCPPACRPCLSS